MKKRNYLKYEEKYLLLKNHFQSDISLEQLLKEFKVSRNTVYNWLRKIEYNFENIERLKITRTIKERKSRIKLELSDEIKKEILLLISKHPLMGALKIKQYFFRHKQILLSEKKIYFYLKEEGIIEARNKSNESKKAKETRRFEYPVPLSAIQIDLLTLKLTGGQKLTLITLIDDYSRYILASVFVPVKEMSEVIKISRNVIKKHGIFERVICDKGCEFVSWQSFTRFEEFLCDWDIELIASGPHQPQCQGKIERWHKTLREEFEGVHGGFSYHSEAQLALDKFVCYYNNERPHQALLGLVPADRFYGLSEELEKELGEYKNGKREDEIIYFTCNIQGKKIVISGAKNEEASVYINNCEVINYNKIIE